MPELPEVETMRRGILPIVGATIREISLVPCARRPILVTPALPAFRQRVVKQQVQSVERLGKRVIVQLSSGDGIVFEPRMTGLVLVADPPSAEHLRVRLDFTRSEIRTIWYWDRRGLGSVRLLTAAEITSQIRSQLGPDALTVTAPQLRSLFAESKRAIKVALLDQAILAGVGNLYASEILHRARIHPEQTCQQLTSAQWSRIHEQMLAVLAEAIEHEGSTLSDGTYRNALNKQGGYQNCHLVYDRAGEPCQTCERSEIARIVQAQRSTFFCPSCQSVRKKSASP
jgi:formamidopyrimidine-DNA glycosylase